MVAFPKRAIDLISGLFGGGSKPFLLTGLTQYFSNMPWCSHRRRDCRSEAARIALLATDWYSLSDRPVGCFCFVVGKGLSAMIRVGRTSPETETDGDEREPEVGV